MMVELNQTFSFSCLCITHMERHSVYEELAISRLPQLKET